MHLSEGRDPVFVTSVPRTLAGTGRAFHHCLSTWDFIQQQSCPVLFFFLQFQGFSVSGDAGFGIPSVGPQSVHEFEIPTLEQFQAKKEGTARAEEGSWSDLTLRSLSYGKERAERKVPERPTYLGFTGSPALARCSSDKLQNLKLLIKCQINRLARGEARQRAVCAPARSSVIDGL